MDIRHQHALMRTVRSLGRTVVLVQQAFGVVATPVTHPGTGRVHLLYSVADPN